MGLTIIVLLFASALFVLFRWADVNTRKNHARFTRKDVRAALENALGLDGQDFLDVWDLFLGFPIDDPYVESVRQRCRRIREEYGEPAHGSVRHPSFEALCAILDELETESGSLQPSGVD